MEHCSFAGSKAAAVGDTDTFTTGLVLVLDATLVTALPEDPGQG